MNALFSLYRWKFATVLVYMLQSTEYQTGPYLKWFWRTQNFNKVMHRRTLDRTKAARMLLWALRLGMFAQLVFGVSLVAAWHWYELIGGWQFGLALILSYPIVWAHLAVVPLVLGRWFIVRPQQHRKVRRSAKIFADHPGIKIAIAGSYGKTSMKELLVTVLSVGKKVAATPANRNVAISHAQFAHKLDGDEDVLIIEYGEGKPGDVARFARTTRPTHVVITGVAPAHLDQYRTVHEAGKDIFAATKAVPADHVYVTAESPDAQQFISKHFQTFDVHGALGWKVSKIHVTVEGTSFVLSKGKRKLQLASRLLGRHQVGPLAFAAAFALELGMTDDQVAEGVAKTAPFEHRMEPYNLNGAWIIDDTYNGNIEGVRAGTALLKELSFERKWYVTPGLVDQGRETRKIHRTMGELIAAANPNIVVLMQNSATKDIVAGLKAGEFAGELRIEQDPLEFYTNLQQFIAAGDVVLMQNDWTDNYA